MVYNIIDEQTDFILSSDNGFQQVYENRENAIIRVHYKFITYNEPLFYSIDTILEILNKQYQTKSEDWTICIKEKMLNNKHIIYYYFYSHIYSIKLIDLKKSIGTLYLKYIHIDESIYYRKIKKYNNCIIADIPHQSDYSKKYFKYYKLFSGNLKDSLLEKCEKLKLYVIEC
jgi:hypothetical protein